MNRIHQWFCSSEFWGRNVERRYLPWALANVDLGPDVLEIGPGYGMTTRVLAQSVSALTAIELDPRLAARVRQKLGSRVRVVEGDGTRLPFESGTFSAVVCFTMLHHVKSPALQDRLFAEAARVLRPGGVFAGADSLPSLGFRMVHLGDTMVMVDPEKLPPRLTAAGFEAVRTKRAPKGAFKFSAHKPS